MYELFNMDFSLDVNLLVLDVSVFMLNYKRMYVYIWDVSSYVLTFNQHDKSFKIFIHINWSIYLVCTFISLRVSLIVTKTREFNTSVMHLSKKNLWIFMPPFWKWEELISARTTTHIFFRLADFNETWHTFRITTPQTSSHFSVLRWRLWSLTIIRKTYLST